MTSRLVVGITGASGAPLAVELLKQMKELSNVESHVVCSRGGELTLHHECDMTLDNIKELADHWYDNDAIGEKIASGSFHTLGMVVIPCSMKSLAGIVSGYADTLLLRAADVTMKERRKLILVPRECPLSTLHLRNMTLASELGAMILPPVPAYYRHPQTIDEVNSYIASKILSYFHLTEDTISEWEGM